MLGALMNVFYENGKVGLQKSVTNPSNSNLSFMGCKSRNGSLLKLLRETAIRVWLFTTFSVTLGFFVP